MHTDGYLPCVHSLYVGTAVPAHSFCVRDTSELVVVDEIRTLVYKVWCCSKYHANILPPIHLLSLPAREGFVVVRGGECVCAKRSVPKFGRHAALHSKCVRALLLYACLKLLDEANRTCIAHCILFHDSTIVCELSILTCLVSFFYLCTEYSRIRHEAFMEWWRTTRNLDW